MSESSLRILQITDLHITADPEKDYMRSGINTAKTLTAVLSMMEKQEETTNQVFITGDLVQNPVAMSYQRLKGILAESAFKFILLAGNHDNPKLITENLCDGNASMPVQWTRGNWLFVILNTCQQPEQTTGYLSAQELYRLEKTLEENPEKHVLILLHHPPVEIGSEWMDRIGLDNADEFLQIIDGFEHVKGIVFGHIHQDFGISRNNVKYIGTPSTCLQFKPGSYEFAKDILPPAYRWMELHENGKIETGVEYLQETLNIAS